ncbi:MAG: DUF2269 family protein [Actinomycetota bacterium]
MDWVTFWLFLHVMGAIAGFGVSFAFPFLGAQGGKDPAHANFAFRVTELISQRWLIPLAILQGITGIILILTVDWDLFANEWLYIGIALYLIAFSFSLLVQARTEHRLIELTSLPPPQGATGGPPPEVAALGRRLRLGGVFLAANLIAIVVLMVYKPGAS